MGNQSVDTNENCVSSHHHLMNKRQQVVVTGRNLMDTSKQEILSHEIMNITHDKAEVKSEQ